MMNSKGPSFLFLLLSLCVALASAQTTALRGSVRFLEDQGEDEPPTTDDVADAAADGLATVGLIIIIIVAAIVFCIFSFISCFCCC